MTRFNTTPRTAALVKKGIALTVVATLVSGCMGSGPTIGGAGGFVSQTNYQAVQKTDFADGSKGCRELKEEVAAIDDAIRGVDRKIQGSRTTNNAIDLLGGFIGFNSNQQSLANFGKSQATNEVYRLEGVKRNYQQRRDTLFRGYVNKGCA